MIVSRILPALGFAENSRIRIGAHAAGVRALIAVEDALVILRGLERNSSLAIAEDDEADFFAFEELFDHHRKGQSGERGVDFRAILRDDHAFAGGQAIGLQNDRDIGNRVGNSARARSTVWKRAVGMPSFSMKRFEWILLPSSAAFSAVGPTIAMPRARN